MDINGAPADVIAEVCDIEPRHADAIVSARAARGGAFFAVDEIVVDVDLPVDVQDQVRDRAFI